MEVDFISFQKNKKNDTRLDRQEAIAFAANR